MLAVTTGMRQGELFGLQWSDIDFEGKKVSVRRQCKDHCGIISLASPKTHASLRTISINEATVMALEKRKQIALDEGHDGLQVFTSPKGKMIRRTQWGKRVWKPLLERLSIRHRGAHHIRHTAITMMLTAGVPLHILAGYVGHTNGEMILRVYAHWIPTDSRIAAEVMSRLINVGQSAILTEGC